jgi:tetratricopeptide (TPR) repeat protein
MSILAELEGDAGLAMWQMVRDVLLWAATPPANRGDLFAAGAFSRRHALIERARFDSALNWPVRVLSAVVADPAGADSEGIQLACTHVSEWAETRGYGGTAVWFAQAAAAAQPGLAAAGRQAGAVARRHGWPSVAETWFRRTVALARRSGEWTAYSEAWLELGDLLLERGDVELARTHYLKSVRASRRHGIMSLRRRALQGLARVAMRAGVYAEAKAFAETARRGMEPVHPAYLSLTLDVAEIRVRCGEYSAAAPLLKQLLFAKTGTDSRLRAAALLAHAAAGLQDRGTMEQAWEEAEALLRAAGEPTASGVTAPLLDLARAAALATNTRRAAELARRALASATRTTDEAAVKVARAMIEELIARH